MKNKSLSNKNGITLIALIITIIVMLILVAVTINMAVNGGLFGYAGNAAKETKEAIKEEQGLGSLADGMTTDELITKFTTDKKADLAKLKKFFIDRDETSIPNAVDSVKYIVGAEIDETHGYEIYKYNNNLYKMSLDTYNGVYTNVEPITEEETILLCSVGTINGVEYFHYNNTNYKETENGVEEYKGVLVDGGTDNIIAFIPKANQTWYGWSMDESSNDDITMVHSQNLSLKDVIKYCYQNGGEMSDLWYSYRMNSGMHASVTYLYGGDELGIPKCGSKIVAGGIYVIDRETQ